MIDFDIDINLEELEKQGSVLEAPLAILSRLITITVGGASAYAFYAAIRRAKKFKEDIEARVRGSSFRLFQQLPATAALRYSELLSSGQTSGRLGLSNDHKDDQQNEKKGEVKSAFLSRDSLTPPERLVFDFLADNPFVLGFAPILLFGVPALMATTVYNAVSQYACKRILDNAQKELDREKKRFYKKVRERVQNLMQKESYYNPYSQHAFEKAGFWDHLSKIVQWPLHLAIGLASGLSLMIFLISLGAFDTIFKKGRQDDDEVFSKRLLMAKVPTPFPIQFVPAVKKRQKDYFKSLEDIEAELT